MHFIASPWCVQFHQGNTWPTFKERCSGISQAYADSESLSSKHLKLLGQAVSSWRHLHSELINTMDIHLRPKMHKVEAGE